MKKFLSKGRGVLLILLLVICVFSINSFSSIDLEKTAIIISLGIDYADDEYVVTGQLALPASSGGTEAPSQSPTMITGKGPTPAAAFHNIASLTGWLPTLSFCTVVILGEETTQKPLMDVMDFVLRVKQLNDSSLFCATRGTAADFFNQKTPLDQISSFSLLKILSKENTQSSDVSVMSLKNFIQNYYRQGNGNFLPLVRSIPDENEENRTEEPNKDSRLSDLAVDEMIVFNQDRRIEILDKSYVKPFVLLTKPVNTGTVNLTDVETSNYKAKNLEVQLQSKPAKLNLKIVDGRVACEVSYEASIQVLHLESDNHSAENLVDGHVPDEIKDALKEKLIGEFQVLLDKLTQLNCDLLQLEEKLYKFHPKDYRAYKEAYGQNHVADRTDYTVKVKIDAKD